MIRILHFSDVHVHVPVWKMPWRGFFGKRFFGAANLYLRRSRRFLNAPQKLAALAEFVRVRGIDLVLFTGDCTALGTEPEYKAARAAMDPLTEAPMGMLCIPGNHDLYLPDSVAERNYERYFGDLTASDLPEVAVDGRWPLVRLIEDSVALIAVNSARPNPKLWLSTGSVPDVQLEALPKLFAHAEMRNRFIFVLTHFGPRRRDGTPDTSLHGFDNGEAFLSSCADLKPGAVLHGHIHERYFLRVEGVEPPIFNAGSATYEGRESIWVFEIEGEKRRAIPGKWYHDRYLLDEGSLIDF
ncbi:MAG: metallophosphoesterase [Deltaproteobacteria bacterium]|nr:metallophosphoesterase [Deltaproteobacteria bacterium]